MNDRLRIASEQLAALNSMHDGIEYRHERVQWALAEADALLAAAGEQETREPKPGEIDHAYLVQHNDALIAACDTARSKLATAEGIIEDLQAQLTAVLADNERMRGVVVSRAEYDRRVAEADEWKRRAEAHRAKYDAAVLEIASLKRRLGPLTLAEAQAAWDEWDGRVSGAEGMLHRDRAIMAVKARRGE